MFVELGDPSRPSQVEVRRPEGDARIAIWAWGLWADGAEEERLVADVDVDGGDFFFFFSAPDEPLGSFTHCCRGDDEIDVCAVCPEPSFSCSPQPVCGP